MTVLVSAPQLLTTEQAADFLNVAPQTLMVWRCHKRYDLPYVRVGRAIRYRLADLEAFVARNVEGGQDE